MLKHSDKILYLYILSSFYCLSVAMEGEDNFQNSLSDISEIIGDAQYPDDFLWGTAVAEWQNSGSTNCGESNWSEFEKGTHKNGQPTIKDGQQSDKSCDSWNNMERDISYMKEIGLNSYRFSVSWEAIEPVCGTYNKKAIDHYHKLIELLLEANITPMITLHHFVHPAWFEQLGGFEKQDNIVLFVDFAKVIFEQYSEKVKLWCIINEANVSGFQSYINGAFPPGKVAHFGLATTILRNLMEAHTETYLALKELKNGQESQIGFVHQYLKFEPYGWINPLERIIAATLTTCFANQIVLDFLKTKKFSPLGCIPSPYDYQAPTEGPIADFIGLNFYSRVLVKNTTPSCYADEIMTEMPYALCPDKFYDAIRDISSIELPIYITENGIADKSDVNREIYFKQYLTALSKAIKDNYDIRGFYYWTLIDNFEWDEGFNKRFGLVEYNTKTGESKLRKSVKTYTNIIRESQNHKE